MELTKNNVYNNFNKVKIRALRPNKLVDNPELPQFFHSIEMAQVSERLAQITEMAFQTIQATVTSIVAILVATFSLNRLPELREFLLHRRGRYRARE